MLSIILTTTGFAQPILSKSNFCLNYVDSTTYHVADTNSLLNTTIGANVIFDYANLKGYGMIQKAYYVDPATTANASSFPTANLAEKSDAAAANLVYSLISNDSVTDLGFVADIIGFGLTTAKYNVDPEKIMRFPFQYANSYSDHYAGSFSANVVPVGVVSTNAAGDVTIDADAWGRLDLPFGVSIDSVIRIKRVETTVTETIVLTPLPSITPITVHAVIVSYYKPSISKAPLISFVDASYTQNSSIVQSNKTVISQYPIGVVSVEEKSLLRGIGLYPNPSKNGSTRLSINTEKSMIVKIDVLNMLGQKMDEVTNSRLNVGKNSFEINTSKLNPGIYFIAITSSNDVKIAKKFMVE